MRGDEKRIVDAFCTWLEDNGWTVQQEVSFVDIVAQRDDERLYAEAKGRTTSPGLDVDTLYGQLLRRMPKEPVAKTRFGVVVPVEGRTAALRVPLHIRQLLRIDVFVVDRQGQVEVAGSN